MIYIGNSEISNIYIGEDVIYGIYCGDLLLFPTDFGVLTGITIEDLAWVTDIPASGGTATSANCSFNVYAHYDSGKSKRVTRDAVVSGSLAVPATTASTREMVGTMTLTATYSGFTDTDTVEVWQKKYSTAPVSITTNKTVININYTATTQTRVVTKISCWTDDANYCRIMGANGIWYSTNSFYLTLNGLQLTNMRYYAGGKYFDNALTGITPQQIVKADLSTTAYTFYDENDVQLSHSAFTSNYQPTVGFGIGGCIGGINPADRQGGYNTFYYVQIYEGNTLVRDLIPWENEQGYGCLKDTLTDIIYNADTPSSCVANYEQ